MFAKFFSSQNIFIGNTKFFDQGEGNIHTLGLNDFRCTEIEHVVS